jgi:hypothetical protein
MKRLAVLLVLFGAGFLVASFALADDGGRDRDKTTSTAKPTTSTKITSTVRTTTSTTTTTPKKKCKSVSMKGTAGATSFTITVDKASKAARSLKGKTATLTFSGKVSVNAKLCSTGSAASTFELRNLHVRSGHDEDDDD